MRADRLFRRRLDARNDEVGQAAPLHGRRMLEAGVRCIISTDAGIGPAKPHDLLVQTITHAVEDLGATVEQALAMCTASSRIESGRPGSLRSS